MLPMNDDARVAAWIGGVLVLAGIALALVMLSRHPDSLFVGALVFFALAELGIHGQPR
jgi:hypothetical protein